MRERSVVSARTLPRSTEPSSNCHQRGFGCPANSARVGITEKVFSEMTSVLPPATPVASPISKRVPVEPISVICIGCQDELQAARARDAAVEPVLELFRAPCVVSRTRLREERERAVTEGCHRRSRRSSDAAPGPRRIGLQAGRPR